MSQGGQGGQPRGMTTNGANPNFNSAYGANPPGGGQPGYPRFTGGQNFETAPPNPPQTTGPGYINGPTNLYNQGPTAGMSGRYYGPPNPGMVIPPGMFPGSRMTGGGNMENASVMPDGYMTTGNMGGQVRMNPDAQGQNTGGGQGPANPQNFTPMANNFSGGAPIGPGQVPQRQSFTPDQMNSVYNEFGLDPTSNGGAWWQQALSSGQQDLNGLRSALNAQQGGPPQSAAQGMNKPLFMDKGPQNIYGGQPSGFGSQGYRPGSDWFNNMVPGYQQQYQQNMGMPAQFGRYPDGTPRADPNYNFRAMDRRPRYGGGWDR